MSYSNQSRRIRQNGLGYESSGAVGASSGFGSRSTVTGMSGSSYTDVSSRPPLYDSRPAATHAASRRAHPGLSNMSSMASALPRRSPSNSSREGSSASSGEVPPPRTSLQTRTHTLGSAGATVDRRSVTPRRSPSSRTRDHSAPPSASHAQPTSSFVPRTTSSTPTRALTKIAAPCGLTNLGNTCFMNSILQCLVHTPELTAPFLDGRYAQFGIKSTRRSSLAGAFRDLVDEMVGANSENARVCTPRTFLSCVSSWDRRFGGGQQHDSQEFLHSLLDGIATECNRVKGKPQYKELQGKGTVEEQAAEARSYARSWQDSLVEDVFGGQLQSTVTCRRCHRQTHCFDPFLDLSVPIPKKGIGETNLLDCLRAFTEAETLDGREKYQCESCRSPQPVTKKLSIYHFPKILILNLKRFATSNSMITSRFISHTKDNTLVRYDFKGLDLSSFASQGSSRCAPFCFWMILHLHRLNFNATAVRSYDHICAP